MDIVQILIFIGVIIFIIVKQYKEVSDNRSQQQNATETSREDTYTIEEGEQEEMPIKADIVKEETPKKIFSTYTPIPDPGRTSTRKVKKEEKGEPRKAAIPSGEKIRLDNPAEARRAFIYSEIFNRKY